MRRLMLCLLLVFTAGCGRVFLGDTQKVEINVTPADARIKIPDRIDRDTNPFTIELPRNESHLVEITKPGYETKWIVLQKVKLPSVIVADILLTLGIGLFIDIYWGTWEGLKPSRLDVTLEPESVEGGPVNVPLNLAESTLTVQDGSVRIKVHVLE
ncbi:MAG: hypothetical protein F4Y38_14585 [Gemmatimonadetes bacterium]|nr:hypothetical protein [Gemmatimonadota bacterium]MYG86315.1 hypothetical protein [Gemmatimonadota bacterium]MYJ90738.1 hypothetical protein [Gemmatimonadota bacterium]